MSLLLDDHDALCSILLGASRKRSGGFVVYRHRIARLACLLVVVAAAACAGVAAPGHAISGWVASGPPFAVGLRLLRLVDHSRTVRLPGGRVVFRKLDTFVRYPAVGPASAGDGDSAPDDRQARPFPLVVFAHGFGVTPATYAGLLRAWARAGYVVAAPVFPLTNPNAPGGPDEHDLIHQPTDVSFVISSLLTASAAPSGPLSGHSDGADTALAVAFNRRVRDRRIGAAIVMSGAEMTGLRGYRFGSGEPALLAVQGDADTSNPPVFTRAYYEAAVPPKFLLALPDARHLAPYTWQQPQARIVGEATTAFLDHYLKHAPLTALLDEGNQPPFARLTAHP